jgi:TPR repeat protein
MTSRSSRFGRFARILLALGLAAANGIAAAADGAIVEHEDALVMTQLAARYEHAEGVDRDFNRAANLYCRAARIGRAEAQYRLGWMYANGRGVPRDDGIAAALFALAAAQGHEQSKRILFYVRPNSATTLPACLLVTAWAPSLRLSTELTPAVNVGAAPDAYQDSPNASSSRPTMQAAR